MFRELGVLGVVYAKAPRGFWIPMQAAQKTQRQGARRSMSGGVLFCTLTRNRSSATKHMSFFSSLPLYFTQCSTLRITDQRGCLGRASRPRIQWS